MWILFTSKSIFGFCLLSLFSSEMFYTTQPPAKPHQLVFLRVADCVVCLSLNDASVAPKNCLCEGFVDLGESQDTMDEVFQASRILVVFNCKDLIFYDMIAVSSFIRNESTIWLSELFVEPQATKVSPVGQSLYICLIGILGRMMTVLSLSMPC